MLPRKACEVRAHFKRDDMTPAPGQGQSRFACAASDLEGARKGGIKTRGRKQRVIKPTGWLTPSLVIEFSDLVEGLRALQAAIGRNLHFFTVSAGVHLRMMGPAGRDDEHKGQ